MNRYKANIYIFLIAVLSFNVSYGQLYINEFQASHGNSVFDSDYKEFSDWIELYNAGSSSINIEGYFLSDDSLQLQKWELPNRSIPANGFLQVWADNNSSGLHTNFKLDGDGEAIYLVNPAGLVVDSVQFREQYPTMSQGRYPGGGEWYMYDQPSPGEDNPPDFYPLGNYIMPEVHFSPPAGFYQGGTEVWLSHPDTNAVIYYTLDGSSPDTTAELFSAPIHISSTRVIRAKAFRSGKISGLDKSATYFIDENFDLPVISLSFDSSYFWDEEIGMYLPDNKSTEYSWERPVNMELFDARNPYISMGAGTKLYGAISRFVDMPSLAVFARQDYGTKAVESKLFDDKDIDKFKSFVLRNSGSDREETMFRDAVQQCIVRHRMDIDYQEYQPAIVYFNGNYWGIHNIREKLNENYLEANHGADPDSVDIIFLKNTAIEGSAADFEALDDFVRYNDLEDQANYEVVKDWMDIDEFMNYRIAQIYFHNEDWPHNNRKFWREQKEGSKWRWMLYDLDFGFDGAGETDNMVAWATDVTNYPNQLFTNLLDNDEFRYEFLQRFRAHMATSFQPETVIALIDSFQERLRPYMPRHIDKWGEPSSISDWESEVERLRYFANHRLSRLEYNLNYKFNLWNDITLSVYTDGPSMGKVFICKVELPDTFAGEFYRNIPLRLEAVAEKGYRFVGWTGAVNDTSKTIILNLLNDESLVARFIPISPAENIFINEVVSENTQGLEDESGEKEDWIEIFNAGADQLDLAGLMLSDDPGALGKSVVPYGFPDQTTVLPGESLIFFADGEKAEGARHLDFKLAVEGECIYLSQARGSDTLIIDSLRFNLQYSNLSFGRYPDGSANVLCMPPTPGSENRQFERVTGILINEFSADNVNIVADEQNSYNDWIELYNANPSPVNIGGLFLTNSPENRFQYRIPDDLPQLTTMPAGGYLLIWADKTSENFPLHANFSLSSGGGYIGLATADGTFCIDSLVYPAQYKNTSLSRYPNAGQNWVSIPPSPQEPNIYNPLDGIVINEFSAHNTSLIADEYNNYSDWIEVYNSNTYSVNLGGVYLSDSLDKPYRYRISTQSPSETEIAAGGYLVLFADKNSDLGARHLDFTLPRAGGQLALIGQLGEIIDSLSYTEQYKNASLSRFPNATGSWAAIPSTPAGYNYYRPVQNIYINEIAASNSQYTDEYGVYGDWIEIYNANDHEVNLAGFFISDSAQYPQMHRIPGTQPDSTRLPAHGHKLLWADGDTQKGALHLSFKLSGAGEQIRLSNAILNVVDEISYGPQVVNQGISRFPDGTETWLNLPHTPNKINALPNYTNVFINEISPANNGEVLDEYLEADDWIELYNDNPYPVNLAGLYFSDEPSNPNKHRIPATSPVSTTIPPYDYQIFWADNSPEQGANHLSFKISSAGECISLYSEYGMEPAYVDSVTLGQIGLYQSYGRNLNNIFDWKYFEASTPLMANGELVDILSANAAKSGLMVYPNPFQDDIHINIFTSGAEEGVVELYNMQGHKVYSTRINKRYAGWESILIKIPTLEPGMYHVLIQLGNVQESISLIRE